MRCKALLLLFMATTLYAQKKPYSCSQCATWNMPQKPFKIYGNTYYVGPHGLSSLLLTSDAGHILIDAALPESVPQIVEHIRSLGFRVEDIKLIVTSHVHFDHAGGVPELQKMSGARVVASPWTADAMKKGELPHDDPQYGSIPNIAPIAHVESLKDSQVLHVGPLAITAHLTPGHTPGGTSWTWTSCENGRCLNMVYADSVTPVSADGFLFSRRKDYPHAEDFEQSFKFLKATPCDILITPHPEIGDLWNRRDNLVDPKACKGMAEAMQKRLNTRLAEEAPK